ncbi:hypothetical protein [Bradyrhizobium symbiodeficiens]|uniref:Uncharacterized protein n=1 Tax=Bradyrhizobium symbiodeficiens TaxID=1404367 RepID=A0A6G8ZYR3_9BRAD|nr:hypothetical protein [Bradyrhizobium symbiodeficiens]QIP05194.1 hypothetical protein HAV00_02535 [Bradyrhizobium symbiodeficiens]
MPDSICARTTTNNERARWDVANTVHRKRAVELEQLQPDLHSAFAHDLDLIVLHSPGPGRKRGALSRKAIITHRLAIGKRRMAELDVSAKSGQQRSPSWSPCRFFTPIDRPGSTTNRAFRQKALSAGTGRTLG